MNRKKGLVITVCVLLCGMIFIIPVLKQMFHIDLSQNYRCVEGVENIVFQANWNPELYYERCFWGLKQAEVPDMSKEPEEMQAPKSGSEDHAQQEDTTGWEAYLMETCAEPGNVVDKIVISPDGNYVLYREIEYNYKKSGLTDDEYCYYRVYDVNTGEVVTVYEAYQEWYSLMWKQSPETKSEAAEFAYGLESSELSVSEITWEDYPGWKEVTFQVAGRIMLQVPKGEKVSFGDNLGDFKELSRETKMFSDGSQLFLYDEVVCELDNISVQGNVVEIWDGHEIIKATNGYQWKVFWDSGETVIGCILPMAEEMQFWSSKENMYAGRNLEVYFTAFDLSRTYMKSIVNEGTELETTKNAVFEITGKEDAKYEIRKTAQKVSLIQFGDSPFCYKILNERDEDLLYGPGLPDLEMWYDGIWIKVKEPYDAKPNVYSVCKSGQELIVEKQEKELRYPYLLPGLYRLVIIDSYGDCVISNVFEIK